VKSIEALRYKPEGRGLEPNEVEFFKLPDHSIRTVLLGSTLPQQKRVPGMFLKGEGLPAHKADNLTATCEPIFQKV
jgi:hypothetical protein